METATINGLPVFNAVVADNGCGMFAISLVDDPAVMSNFLKFDNQRKQLMYAVADEEKRLVRGVVMRADFPIYRRDEWMGEFYVIYSAEQIRKMAEKYLKDGWPNAVNLDHNCDNYVNEVNMVQYFIKGNGVSVEGFDDIADGSLFAEFHVNNYEVWDAIKAGTYKGFSLEGVFELQPSSQLDEMAEIVEALDGKFNQILNNDMTKKEKVLAALAKMLTKCGNVTTDKGVISWDGEEDLKAGNSVFVEDQEGNRTAAADGEFVTEDGKTIVVVDGKVSEIKDPEAEVDGAGCEGKETKNEGEEPAGEAGEPAGEGGESVDDKIEGLRKEVNELYDIVDKLLKSMGESRDTIEEMKAQIAKPAAAPAHEEFNEQHHEGKTGVKGLDILAKRLGR